MDGSGLPCNRPLPRPWAWQAGRAADGLDRQPPAQGVDTEPMSVLDGWILGEHTASGVTHPTYRKGTGPGVVVISEIPGITEDVIGFAEEVVGRGSRW